MAEQPPLNRSYVISYSANDRDFPVIGIRLDPRVAGYRVPEDLSPHPDSKRYPNHIFTGSQPSSGDERVTHVYEILPSPWVPFTRYDDDLGPIQGRRRSVKNEGQVASLVADKRTTYEAREGSAIVYNEIEESWSTSTDDDGNSLFPIKDRDVYDPRFGAIRERRQLIVPNGTESASIEYVDPNIVETGYEAYNEYLSFKVVRTYALSGPVRREDIYEPIRGPVQRISQLIYDTGSLQGSLVNQGGIITQTIYQPVNTLVVDRIVETYQVNGPQLIGSATNNEKQLTTVTTQRKGASGYVTPNPTATKTVEVSREDAESLVERIIESPNVFDAKTLSASKPDVIPEQFRASVPSEAVQEIVEQSSVQLPSLSQNELEKSEQRITEFTVRKSKVSRDNGSLPVLKGQEYEPSINIVVPFEERVTTSGASLGDPATFVDPLSKDFDLVKEIDIDAVQEELDSIFLSFPTRTSLNLPKILKSVRIIWDGAKGDGSYASNFDGFTRGTSGSLSGSESGRAQASASVSPGFVLDIEEVYATNIPTTSYFFFLKYPITLDDIFSKVNASPWPIFKPVSRTLTAFGQSASVSVEGAASASSRFSPENVSADKTEGSGYSKSVNEETKTITIPPCINSQITVQNDGSKSYSGFASFNIGWTGRGGFPSVSVLNSDSITVNGKGPISIPAVNGPTDIPRSGLYLIDSRVEIYQYGYARVYAEVLDASIFS